MRSGKCPKCGSTEVYTRTDLPFNAGDGRLHLHASGNDMYLDALYCANCGYVEMYVQDPAKAKANLVKDKNWRRILPS